MVERANTERQNIVLTGFMGTGKSSVGRTLALISNREFVDLDKVIAESNGPIPLIFAEQGEERFRELEREAVAEVAARRNLVIATGGGTLLDEDNVVALLGADIYALTADVETIVERVTADGIEERPLLAKAEDPAARIAELLAERSDQYGRFTQIDTTDKSIEQVVTAIENAGADVSASRASAVSNLASTTRADGEDPRERLLWGVIGLILAVLVVVLILVLSF